MGYKLIKLNQMPHRLDISLNNPPVNILTGEVMKELTNALQEAEKDESLRIVVLKSEGKAWSAGADVSEHLPDKYEEMLYVFGELCETVRKFPLPTIAAVDGMCLGGGCELACMCDFIIASERSKFGQPEVKVGVLPPVACAIFPRKYGLKTTLDIVLTGETFSATEAYRMGLITKLTSLEDFGAACEAFAGNLTNHSAAVMKWVKKSAWKGAKHRPKEALKKIDEIYREKLMQTHDAVEGIKAFLEKRKPEWKDN
ncbi:MAG: enoyl-CoA hydratase/isomerase family protein [Calditrichota bacterium]